VTEEVSLREGPLG